MAIREILLLGDPGLHVVCEEYRREDLPEVRVVADDLCDTLLDFRARHGRGRAIAAPQIGVARRLIYMQVDKPTVLVNPRLSEFSREMMTLWDDCMSFPDLLVRLRRHHTCTLTYHDLNWDEIGVEIKGDLSELLQHECDHLDGILATQRAIDDRSLALRKAAACLK